MISNPNSRLPYIRIYAHVSRVRHPNFGQTPFNIISSQKLHRAWDSAERFQEGVTFYLQQEMVSCYRIKGRKDGVARVCERKKVLDIKDDVALTKPHYLFSLSSLGLFFEIFSYPRSARKVYSSVKNSRTF